jgi:hypothetical protein
LPEGAIRDSLQTASASQRPVRAFTQTISQHSATKREWHERRVQLVQDEITKWIAEHQLNLEWREDRRAPGSQESVSASADTASNRADDDRTSELRDLLHRAIERMPETELLALRLPVEYLVDR